METATHEKIDLKPEHEALIETRYHEFLEKGYSTKPISKEDKAEIEAAIERIYKREGLPKPGFKWVKSPAKAQEILKKHGVDAALTSLWGAYDLYWLAFYEVGREIAKLAGQGELYDKEDAEELDDMLSISKATLWYPFDDCIICDTPKEVHTDEAGNLHNDAGPALLYRDRICLWMIHGVEVTEKIVINPSTLTVKEITEEPNAEKKRIMIERYGAGKYAEATGAKILDVDQLALEGSAPRILVEINDGGKWLIGTDGGTGRIYWMAVDRNAMTCRTAHESISFCDETKILEQS